jgi:voltage-gated potassium channel Kch
LGLFFIAVGMDIDLDRVAAEPQIIAAGVAVLLAVKFSILYLLGLRPGRLQPRAALMLAGVMWLGGEFAFVVFSEAVRVGLLDDPTRDRLVAVVGVSMAMTPLLLIAMSKILARVKKPVAKPEFDTIEEIDSQQPQVLIAGMGRFGQIVARLLTAQRIPFVALEHSPEQVEDMRRFGNRIYYGDPTRPELLRAAGAQHVKVFVIAVDDTETNIKATRLIRRMYPKALILARARNRRHAWRLMDLGAEAFRETFGTSLELGEKVLVALGLPPETAADHTKRFRTHDEKLLRAQHLIYDDDVAVVQTARDARADLEKLFEADVSDSDTVEQPKAPEQA